MMKLEFLTGCAVSAPRAAAILALAVAAVMPASAAHAGSVGGGVKFEGEPPAREELALKEANLAGVRNSECVKLHKDSPLLSEEVIVGEGGGLANVVVYVKSPVEGVPAAPTTPALLDQVGCAYTPHVLAMRAGQTLEVRNSDPLVHNVRSFARKNRPFNMGQGEGNVREKVMHKGESAIKLKCDIHRWMTGYIFVFDHPFYAVTGADGAFKIEGLPAGEYTLAAWHEVYGEQEAKVTVGADGAVSTEFKFAAKP